MAQGPPPAATFLRASLDIPGQQESQAVIQFDRDLNGFVMMFVTGPPAGSLPETTLGMRNSGSGMLISPADTNVWASGSWGERP
mmetsp:Transcript_81323/g.251046  ORF Transcript_81323/g.251046 Transcript_81323/m.251046 type:complete len:84 (+) Transcript_81323:3-254(+)